MKLLEIIISLIFIATLIWIGTWYTNSDKQEQDCEITYSNPGGPQCN